MAAGKELNGGVDVEEAGRVDQWPCVSLDLGVVPLPLEKSVHLAQQQTHTPAAAKITPPSPNWKLLDQNSGETKQKSAICAVR